MSSIDPNYELPPPDTVEVECNLLDVSGEIASPTIINIKQQISTHVNDASVHRINTVLTFTTDGVSSFYTIIHNLETTHLQITFYDVTTVPQKLLFVHWEPVSENAIRIAPDVILSVNRTIKVIIQ